MSSHRELRADPAFDKIIQTFYPDIDAYEEKEEEFISRVNAESPSIAAVVEETHLRRQVRELGIHSLPGARTRHPLTLRLSAHLRRQVRTNTHSAPSSRRGLLSSRRGLVSARRGLVCA